MFQGRLFSSGDLDLDPYVAELDAYVFTRFPEFFDGTAERRLRLQPDELTGRGIALAPRYSPAKDTPLAIYFGDVVLGQPPGDFVLALPSFRRAHRTWSPLVDAGARCRVADPGLLNAALFNHSCQEATVCLQKPLRWGGGPLSCAVAYAKDGIPPGGRLLWDYDGGAHPGSSAFSINLATRQELLAAGIDSVPCACRAHLPCPRGRWFRVFP